MTEAHRQSALLLHGLGEADRQWILARLTDEQRSSLNAQLAELHEIGMPADRGLAEELLADAKSLAAPAAAAGVDGAGSISGTLGRAPAQAVLQLLKTQPTWLIAAVLSIEAWPWREAIYIGLDASKRDRVKQAMGVRPPPKLAQALAAQLESRLATMEIAPEPRAATAGWPRLAAGFRQWFRS